MNEENYCINCKYYEDGQAGAGFFRDGECLLLELEIKDADKGRAFDCDCFELNEPEEE